MSTDQRALLIDFVKGEIRWMSEAEHRGFIAVQMRRTKVKNGIVYIDCEPPEGQ